MRGAGYEPEVIDRKEVLIIAAEELARGIVQELGAKATVTVLSPPAGRQEDMSWLIDTLFGAEASAGGGRVGTECTMFAWNRFNAVVLQDSWKSTSGGGEKLEFAGRIFALWDNNRGNFRTKKVVLVAPGNEFESRVRAAFPGGAGKEAAEQVQRVLDRKRAVAMVKIQQKDFLAMVRDAVLGASQSSPTPAPETLRRDVSVPVSGLQDAVKELTSHVVKAASETIRKTILQNTSVFLVDDEESAVSQAYKALTGTPLEPLADDPPTIKLVRVSDGKRSCSASFPELTDLCERWIGNARETYPGRDAVIVMDILFDVGNCTSTGIDLIEDLRDSFKNHIGIVAFTGFTTPFVAMSAYLKGADYVVQKDGSIGAHDALRLGGTDRMIEALAILSFQRTYLRRVRKHCRTMAKKPKDPVGFADEARELARLFERTMPQATVSLHLQQEWEDVHYILKLVQTMTATNGKEIRALLKDFAERY